LLISIDNLIQANNVAQSNKTFYSEVEKLVASPYWVNFANVACYFFVEGTCRPTLDYETKSIGPSNIDNVSEKISDTFEKLLAIKYRE